MDEQISHLTRKLIENTMKLARETIQSNTVFIVLLVCANTIEDVSNIKCDQYGKKFYLIASYQKRSLSGLINNLIFLMQNLIVTKSMIQKLYFF